MKNKILGKNNCSNCRFALFHDYGYSNYTVEGTLFYCLKNLHPDYVFDRWYEEDKRLEYADKCKGYEKGDCEYFDVDGEWKDYLDEIKEEDHEKYLLILEWMGRRKH